MTRFVLTPTQALVSRLAVGGFEPLLPAQKKAQAKVRESFDERRAKLELLPRDGSRPLWLSRA